VDVTKLSAADLDGFVRFLYERFRSTRALLGTVDSCLPLVERLYDAGVDEIACLLDFGPPADAVLEMLPHLERLIDRARATTAASPRALTAAAPAAATPGAKPRSAAALLDDAYEIRWVEATLPPAPLPARTLIVADRNGIGAALADRLPSKGGAVRTIGADRLASDWIEAARALRPTDLVYLGHLDVPEPPEGPTDLGLSPVVELIQALAQDNGGPRVWLVTRGAACVEEGDRVSPVQNALWGLGKVLPIEQPRLWGGLVDLDPAADATTSARSLAGVLAADHREDQLALRGGSIRAARLSHLATVATGPFACRPDATYLITGGLKGLGLEAARWLARRGARHLLLLGRTAPADRPVIDTLERQGVTIDVAVTDVTNLTAVREAIDASRAAGRPAIAGVVHAAGVWHDRPLATMSKDDIVEVAAPKVLGALAVEAALRDTPLDFFIAFSAFSALLPAETQGNYAAANAWLDAFVGSRRPRGGRWLSVNWGPWSSIGFAATEYGRRAHARLDAIGISRIAPDAGFETLDALAGGTHGSVGIMPVDWRTLFERDPNARLSPLLSEMTAAFAPAPADADRGRLLRDIASLHGAEQLAALERELTRAVAAIVRLRPADVGRRTPFTDLGVDSLMAVEIKNRIHHDTGVDLPLVKLLEGPSVADLAVLLLAQIKVSQIATRPAGAAGDLTEIEI
jgi:hypothetical protein